MRARVAILAGALLVIAFAAGIAVRSQLDIELSPESIQETVGRMGWKAHAVFLGLLTFRQFLFLPAILLLPVGGLCFGPALGTLLGASGIMLSALMSFGFARGLGAGWLHALLADRHVWLGHTIERAGPALVGLVTAHPAGPMSALFWGAGFSSMALLPFTLAVLVGGSLRALALSVFGSTLAAAGSMGFYVASGLLAAAVIVPFVHPRVRRSLFEMRRAMRDRPSPSR